MATSITTVKDRLIARGFTLAERIPAVDAQFTIFQSADIPKIQQGYRSLPDRPTVTATAVRGVATRTPP